MLHEVGGAGLAAIHVEADALHAGQGAVAEVAEVEGGVAPVGEEPVLHEAVIFVAEEQVRVARGVFGAEGGDAGAGHGGVAAGHGGGKRALEVGAHVVGDGGEAGGFGGEGGGRAGVRWPGRRGRGRRRSR